jgi:NitT/TauT family transport system substrate-binding protein
MQNKLVVGIIVVLVIGGIWFFVAQKDTPLEATKVKVGFLSILASLPLYVAEENGYFTEAGIEIEKIPFQTGEQLNDAFIRGDIDIAPENTLLPVLRTELLNPGITKVYALGDITKETPFATLIVKNSAPINSLSDLENKKVGVFPGGTSKNLLRRFLDSQGVNTIIVEFVELPPTTQLQALSSGAIDALLAFEPTTAIAIDTGEYRKLYSGVWAEIMNHNPLGVSVISNKFIQEKPNLAKKTVEVFDKAHRFMRINDSEMRVIIAKYVQLKPEIANKVVPLYFGQNKDIDSNLLQQFIDLLVDIGEINGHVDAQAIMYKP